MYDHEKDNLFRRMRAGDGPSWRWHRAGELLDQRRQPDELDDAATIAVWRFRMGLSEAPVAVCPPMPAVADRLLPAAHDIYIENGPQRWEIEARLLAGVTAADIAERIKVDAGIIDAYAATFFDIVGRTDSIGWLAIQLPVGISTPPNPTEPQIWMHVAASGDGAKAALDVLIADYLSRPEPAVADRQQVADDIRTLVRLTGTPPTPTPVYRRLLNKMWRILATRVTVRDPREWEAVVRHMDVLELVAGVRTKRPPAPAIESGNRQAESEAEVKVVTDVGVDHGREVGNEPLDPVGDGYDDGLETGSATTGPFPMLAPGDALCSVERGPLCWPLWSQMVGLAVA